MTAGETEETGTCGGQKRTDKGNMNLSFTTLSTIAIQAGQSQIVVSVLRSESAVHLQLVQVHPGLCEIGSNQEENRTLLQEQQQLMEKLKKHESEVLSAVEKSRQTEQRRRRDEGTMELKRSKKQEEEEEGVYEAMNASLSEGWSLLLRLLERRQEVLTLAADFYCRALEFADSINRLEDLQIRLDSDRLTEEQLTYDSMRRDLLGKSLQVLTCSSVLLQKLRQLQKTEALQRRGGVLQDEQEEEEEEEEENSQCSRGMALRLEELVEALQDRRRRADQAVRLQLQRAEKCIMVHEKEKEESRQVGSEDWRLTVDQILDQNLQSGSAQSTDLKATTEETRDLNTGSPSAENTDLKGTTIEIRDLKTGSRSDVNPESRSESTRDVAPGSRPEETIKLDPNLESTSDLKLISRFQDTRELKPESRPDLQSGSRSDLHPGSKPEQTLDVTRSRSEESKNESGSRSDPKTESRSNVKPKSRLEFKPKSRPDQPANLQFGFKPNLKTGSRLKETLKLLLGSTSDEHPGSGLDVNSESQSEPTRDIDPESRSEETRNLDPKPETGSDLKPGARLGETGDLQSKLQLQSGSRSVLQSGSGLDVKTESRLEFKPESRSEETKNPQSGFKLNLQFGSKSDVQPGSRLDPKPDFRADLNPGSRSEPTIDVAPESRSQETTDLQSRPRSETRELRIESPLDVKSGSGFDVNSESSSEPTRDVAPESRLEETKNLDSKPETKSDLKPEAILEETRNLQSKLQLQSGSRSDMQPGPGLDVKTESRLEFKPESRSDETRNLQSGFKLNLQSGSRSDVQPGSRLDQKPDSRSDLNPGSRSEPTIDVAPESRSQETTNLQSRPRSEERRNLNSGSRSEIKELRVESPLDVRSGSGSEKTRDLQLGSRSEAEDISLSDGRRKQEQTKQRRAATTNTTSGQVGGELQSMLGNEIQSGEDHARKALLANQRQQLLSSCEHLVDKMWIWVQQGSSVLSRSSEAGRQLCEAEDTLNAHLQLQTQAESAGHDAENMKQILDQIRALHTDPTSGTSPLPPSEPSRQLSPLKALTEQLKKGSMTRTTAARPGPPAAGPTGSLSPELAGRADLVLKELQSLNRNIDSNVQLLKPYVSFLRTAQQVEEEMEELREIYRRRPEEDEEEEKQEGREAGSSNIRTASSSRSPVKKKEDVDACWEAAEQRFLTAQELGNNYIHTVPMVSGAGLNLQSVVSVVQQTLERLRTCKQEVNELRSQHHVQNQQQQEYCRKYQERLLKTLQDLNCVSELLDSCTLMDLGSDLQTTKLLEHFSQARPHFKQLDAEVEYMEKNWETLRGIQDRLEVKELEGRAVKEEALSELLKLHNKGWTCFRVEQLEARLLSLDALCVSWQNEAARCEEKLRRELLTCRLNDDINQLTHKATVKRSPEYHEVHLQKMYADLTMCRMEDGSIPKDLLCGELTTGRRAMGCLLLHNKNVCKRDMKLRDSFKELKKRFSNLKFNYQKRNDRARNIKAVRNQLQQVELYDEKLQVLRKRLQGVTARLGSEIKDGGVAREAEDAINELQRQMGDFERSVSEHQKTLDMTRRLQQAMEEYQFWCEEASATIARVGKFSSECRSTEAVSVLYRQFEKFVWPTVPQQEERISQIAELAVRLHGVEEGQRYIEKTVSKHSEMVESIRELSDGLMELEAKLKLENLKKEQKDGEKVITEDGEMERRRESETEEKDEENEKKLKENRKLKKKEQTDNRSTQEVADMYELKETGHTPELTGEHDGKEVPVKRQTAANRKPPLQKSRSLDTDRQTESSHRQHSERLPSYCSTHTFSLSCSPVEANRRIHTIHTEPQATPPPPVIGPSFSDIQREFHKQEMQETGQQGVSTPLQDASAGGLTEAELQQQEAMTEDYLSNDEYDCVSPDDISLPPLAETPESNIFQSDIEEGFCFSSHSVHISQYSHHSEHSGTGTGAVRQQRASSRTESCPTPPTSRHSSTRFRSDSSSFVQSPLIVPAPSLVTSTLCTILKTVETSTANVPLDSDLSLGDPDLSFPAGSNPVHKKDTQASCYNKDSNVSEKRSPSLSEPLLKEPNSQYTKAQKMTSTQVKITKNVASKVETLPQTDPIPQGTELNKGPTLPQSTYCPQPFNGPDPVLHKDKTPPQDTRFLKCSTTFPQTTSATCFPQSFPDSESGLHQELNSSRTCKETPAISKPQTNSLANTSTSEITQKTIDFQSSPSNSCCILPQTSSCLISSQESPLSQSDTLPKIDPVPQARGFAQRPSLAEVVLNKDRTQDTGFLKPCASCPQSSTTIPQDRNLPQTYPDSGSDVDQDVPSSKTHKETSSVSMPQSSSLTTATTVTQQTIYCQSSPPKSYCNVPKASCSLSSPKKSSLSQSHTLPRISPVPQNRFAQSPSLTDAVLHKNRTPDTGFLKTCATCPQTSTIIPQGSNLPQDQTVYSLHESLSSTCTQQCVHDPGMTPSSPAKPTAPPQPESQTQALAQQANPHVIPLSSPPHLLTPDKDPNICQPMAIREEIRLTPQIQGPSLPAPPTLSQAQAESLPQGKASKPGPPCFTRPLSRATVMEGSPVTLEVEVTGHPEPALTWSKDGEVSATGPGRTLACKASDSDGGLYEVQAVDYCDAQRAAGNSSGDKWLVAEVFDIISVDWQTWFGTLCVLLWLIYLIVL
ncbi:uncharacterized protein ccdc141 [Symphorus nematophorus]